MNSLSTLLKVFLITTLLIAPFGLAAKDGFLFNDIPPVSIYFHGRSTEKNPDPFYSVSIMNTSDETIHDVTFSRVVGGSVKKLVIMTIEPHKSVTHNSSYSYVNEYGVLVSVETGISFVNVLDLTGPNSGLTVTCKGFSKPLAVDGWWEGEEEEKAQEYLKAARQGDSEAQCNIAICYYSGRGTPKNSTDAIKWALKAAESGHYEAMRVLSYIYSGVENTDNENLVESMKWMLILTRDKQKLNEEAKTTVAKKITSAQLEEAQRLVFPLKTPAERFIERTTLPPQK